MVLNIAAYIFEYFKVGTKNINTYIAIHYLMKPNRYLVSWVVNWCSNWKLENEILHVNRKLICKTIWQIGKTVDENRNNSNK